MLLGFGLVFLFERRIFFFFFVLVYNYLAGTKLQMFNKLCVEQRANNGCSKLARVQNPNFYFIVLDHSLYNDLHFLWISNTKI